MESLTLTVFLDSDGESTEYTISTDDHGILTGFVESTDETTVFATALQHLAKQMMPSPSYSSEEARQRTMMKRVLRKKGIQFNPEESTANLEKLFRAECLQ
jgi:hypothetical protein